MNWGVFIKQISISFLNAGDRWLPSFKIKNKCHQNKKKANTMIKLICEVVSVLVGKTSIHATAAEINGSYSGGRRDGNGKDFQKV